MLGEVCGKENAEGRPSAIRGDREEPASIQAHEAGRCESQQEEAGEVNPAAEVNHHCKEVLPKYSSKIEG